MHTANLGRPLDNKLLSVLPRDQFDLLAPHFTTVFLSQGVMLVAAGEEFDHVYFPLNGMLSMLAVLQDGKLSKRQPLDAKAWSALWQGSDFINRWSEWWCSFQWLLAKSPPLSLEKLPLIAMQSANVRSVQRNSLVAGEDHRGVQRDAYHRSTLLPLVAPVC
jgi:hypothetical protein